MFVTSFVPEYITNRILTCCADHSWKFALLLLLILFQIAWLVPVTFLSARQDFTKNNDTIVCASSRGNACSKIIFYHMSLLFLQSNTIGQYVKEKITHSAITNHKLWLTHPIWMFCLAIPFEHNCKGDQRNGKLNLKIMAAIVSIIILLTFTLTNTQFSR